jgi:8-oxo-dGTP diphosphatase
VKQTSLCFVIDKKSDHLLMIHKKRGQGTGKWNVPGGKLTPGESPEQAAIRETKEETGLQVFALQEVGRLEFYFPNGNSWDNHCTVFMTENFEGILIKDSAECSCEWVSLQKIPYDKMWDSDRVWAPLVFAGKYFHRTYTFGEKDQLIAEKVIC